MENKHVIIILSVIIVILVAAIGISFLHPFDTKESSKVKIISNKTLTEGEDLLIKLTDLNKTAIPDEAVNITITNSKGKVVFDDVVKTNSKGNIKVDLKLKKGKYNVAVTFGGNKNYTGNNTTQNLTIKEKVVEATVSQSSSSFYDKIKVHVDPNSGGSSIDLSQLSQDEYAQYLGYSDAEEMERETARKRAEARARYYK